MTHRICRLSIAVLAITVAASLTKWLAHGHAITPADQAVGQAWPAHIKTLADDNTEGRLTGLKGYFSAARYVITQFEEAYLQPTGVNSYYQPVKIDVTWVVAEKSAPALVVKRVTQSLSICLDAVLAKRYHSTEDNLSRPVETAAAAQFNSFLAGLAHRVANDPGGPHYVASSFFHRFGTE